MQSAQDFSRDCANDKGRGRSVSPAPMIRAKIDIAPARIYTFDIAVVRKHSDLDLRSRRAMIKVGRAFFFSFVFAFTLDAHAAVPTSKASGPTAAKLRISQSALNTRSAVLWIAQAQGLFAKNGLEAEVILLQSSNLQTAALAAGDVQLATIGGATVLSAVAAGQDLKIVASPSNRLPYDLVVRPEIKEAKDLRAKRFGVTSVGGTTWMAAILALRHFELDLRRDNIQLNAIGNQGVLAQAIEAGNIDMTLVDPFLSRRLQQKGLRVMLELYHANIPFINTSVVASAPYLREHEDRVENFLRAMLEAQAFIGAPGNKSAVMRTVMNHMKITDAGVADEGYQDLFLSLEKKPYPPIEALRNIQRMMAPINPKVAKVNPEQVIDTRLIRKLDESGFIDGLYNAQKR
jgi:ABC-type nitrate/sulfonate/bicarbonate transport system substrate-binding protein